MRHLSWLAVLLFVSCDIEPQGRPRTPLAPAEPHDERGPEIQEKGRVLETAFQMGSSTTTTAASPGYNKTIKNSFLDDPIGLHNKTIVVPSTNSSNTVTVQDQFSVIFECQHGKFIIESLGKESVAHKLWTKLKQGDQVTIRYMEIFRISQDGKKELVKYDFIDAELVK